MLEAATDGESSENTLSPVKQGLGESGSKGTPANEGLLVGGSPCKPEAQPLIKDFGGDQGPNCSLRPDEAGGLRRWGAGR